jgi:hypothetical protein
MGASFRGVGSDTARSSLVGYPSPVVAAAAAIHCRACVGVCCGVLGKGGRNTSRTPTSRSVLPQLCGLYYSLVRTWLCGCRCAAMLGQVEGDGAVPSSRMGMPAQWVLGVQGCGSFIMPSCLLCRQCGLAARAACIGLLAMHCCCLRRVYVCCRVFLCIVCCVGAGRLRRLSLQQAVGKGW